jgi:hypothetical protein
MTTLTEPSSRAAMTPSLLRRLLSPLLGRSRAPSARVVRASLAALALASALGSVAIWPAPASPQEPAAAPANPRFEQFRARFHGIWRITLPQERHRQQVDAAIERSVSAMNFFAQGIARDQLRENTPLNRRIDLVFESDERITVVFDQRYRYTTRVGRRHRFRTPDGDDLRVVQRLRDDGKLEQVFETDRGTRWNVYESTGEGQLRIEATTQGMLMPQPLYFTFDYRRDPS